MSTSPRAAGPTAPWDLSFLRVGTLVTAAIAAVAAPVAGLVAGWEHAAAIAVTAVIVTAFFAVSGLAVAFAGRIGDTLTLPAALLAFGVKALVLFPVFTGLPEDGWLDRRTVGWSVVVGALLWSVVQLRWVWTRQLQYVPAPAPPPGARDSEAEKA
ncbi:hypothetical protein [Candidatus Blastococcus massiliensis]|uniref:hypothetical protein n=1 Tax=Candidatus Blastococcus massiliensis TaxID=1470358 RepID=UPI0004B0A320|nr:hypothetical protein [Candidatus Blastococcus massiliensis]